MCKPENPLACPDGINDGMTLLDYFAAVALNGYIVSNQSEKDDGSDVVWWAYNDAEAMLAERQVRMKEKSDD